MPNFLYNNIEVKIGNSGILADSASLETTNSLQTVYTIGARMFGQTPTGPIKSTLQISYFPEISNDQIFPMIGNFKREIPSIAATGMSVAGVEGSFYLDSLNIKATPNSPVKINASFTSYFPLTGYLQNKTPTTIFNVSESSGLAHGWDTYITLSDHTTYPIYDFSYDFKANWEPEFVIGNLYPNQVHFMGGTENFNFVRDFYTDLSMSGNDILPFLNSVDKNVSIFEIANHNSTIYQNAMLIPLSGKTRSSSIAANLDDFVRVSVSIENAF
jgi:hypothetical protein